MKNTEYGGIHWAAIWHHRAIKEIQQAAHNFEVAN